MAGKRRSGLANDRRAYISTVINLIPLLLTRFILLK